MDPFLNNDFVLWGQCCYSSTTVHIRTQTCRSSLANPESVLIKNRWEKWFQRCRSKMSISNANSNWTEQLNPVLNHHKGNHHLTFSLFFTDCVMITSKLKWFNSIILQSNSLKNKDLVCTTELCFLPHVTQGRFWCLSFLLYFRLRNVCVCWFFFLRNQEIF